MTKAIYPKYSKEENRSCKLTQEQIDEIQELYVPKVFGMRKVAKVLGLPQSTVRYWCLSEEDRKAFNVMKIDYNKKPSKLEMKKRNKDRVERKGEAFKKYESQLKKDYMEKPGVKAKKSDYMKKYNKKLRI